MAPRLLYISPVIPALTGNGLAMRAGAVLEALSRQAEVSLLVIPLYTPVSPSVPAELAERCRRIAIGWSSPAQPPFAGEHFDVVHLFRLATVPFAQPYLGDPRGDRPRRHLDLDDVESLTHHRLAELHHRNGEIHAARAEDQAALRSAALEGEVLRDFDRVYVCSPHDRQRLLAHSQAEMCVLPNAVRLPPATKPERSEGPFSLLFVGTLGYYPNVDALRFFCDAILPELRRRTDQTTRVLVVGTGAGEPVLRLAAEAGLEFVGAVPGLAPYYRVAHAVVVPVRAGGGTRIKVLEAFSYGVPVVSTSIGVEGIDARPGEHLLIADDCVAFALARLQLRDDPALAQRLAHNALSLVRSTYSIDAMAAAIGALDWPQPH